MEDRRHFIRRRRPDDRVWRVGYVMVAVVNVGDWGTTRRIFDMAAWEWCWGIPGLKYKRPGMRLEGQ